MPKRKPQQDSDPPISPPARFNRSFVLSDRLRDAINHLGPDRLMEGVAFLEQHPDLIVVENIGTQERQVYREFKLTAADIDRITALVENSGVRWRAIIVRNAIEHLIAQEGLTQFVKPRDWQAKPLALNQGGKNPVEKLSEPSANVAFTIPLEIWNRIEHLKQPRGQAHIDTLDLSGFIRRSLDEMDPDTLEDYFVGTIQTPQFKTTQMVGVVLFNRQIELIDRLKEELGWTASDVLTAAIRQVCELNLIPEANIPKALRLSREQRSVWKVFGKTCSVSSTAAELGLPAEEVVQLLEGTKRVEANPLALNPAKDPD